MCRNFRLTIILVATTCVVFVGEVPVALAANGELELRVVDQETGKPIAVRMHLFNSRGRPRRVPGTIAGPNYFVIDGSIVLSLPPGDYQFRMERGLEYLTRSGQFVIKHAARDHQIIEMKRFVDMKQLGWRSADFVQSTNPRELAVFCDSEDVSLLIGVNRDMSHMVSSPVRDQTPRSGRIGGTHMAVIDQPNGGLALVGRASDFPTPWPKPGFAASGLLLRHAKRHPALACVAMDVAAADLPMWLCSGRLDAVAVMIPEARRATDGTELHARDQKLFPGPRGMARYREQIYHQLLECGLSVGPLAITRSGESLEPPGAYRTYVATGEADEAGWWNAFRGGPIMLTSGPILLALGNGNRPGTRFATNSGRAFELQLTATLHTRQRISYLEMVQNGSVVHTLPLNDLIEQAGQLPKVTFDESGWLIVRAVVDDAQDYRLAMTGPFFVDVDGQPRISAQATRYFLDWSKSRLDAVTASAEQLDDGLSAVRFHEAAVRYWTERMSMATVP